MSAQIIPLPRRRPAAPRNNYDWMSVRAMQFFRAETAREEAAKLSQVRGILASATPAGEATTLSEVLKVLRRIDRRMAKGGAT